MRHVEVCNLLATPRRSVTDIAEVGATVEGWLAARTVIPQRLWIAATCVLLAYGVT
jgi:hypothetical protein